MHHFPMISALLTVTLCSIDVIAECDHNSNCTFPFFFDGKEYNACTKDYRNGVKWCVTDQTVFDDHDYWEENDKTKRGWEECHKSCDVEQDRDCNVTMCKPSFEYMGHTLNECSTHGHYDGYQGFCVTDQKEFDKHFSSTSTLSDKGNRNMKPKGWTACSRKCSLEHKECKECEFPFSFEYENKVHNVTECTTVWSGLNDTVEGKYIPWCVTDTKKFINHDRGGWEYCSWNCSKSLENEAPESASDSKQNVIIVIILASLSLIIIVFCLYKRHRKSNQKLEMNVNNATGFKANPRRNLSVTCHSKRDVAKENFSVGDILGSGNFGNVFKGEINGLYQPNDKFDIAIKTINDSTNEEMVEPFMEEIKIMSYIDPHLNLVNMIGSCTSEYENTGNLWLLVEFCNHGDLRKYLMEKSAYILSGEENAEINDRLLILWAYDIAQGMKFLSKSQIMHGDLAARNVMISDNQIKSCRVIAKVADFGLSKDFTKLYRIKYTKENRVMVPWKWMAIEYLRNDYFTLTSDVWSFGVVVWEILSFGRMPYGPIDFEELMEKFDNGYRLPCPNETKKIKNWPADQFYQKISEKCFIENPNDRSTFTELVKIIERELMEKEIKEHKLFQEKHEAVHRSNYISHKNSQT